MTHLPDYPITPAQRFRELDLAFLFEIGDDGLCTYLAMLPDAEQAVRLAREREAGA